MPFHSVVDIHLVTDALLLQLRDAINAASAVFPTGSPILTSQIRVTGLAPDLLPAQNAQDIRAYLSLYLFHIETDRFQRNSPVTGPFTTPPGGGSPAARVPTIPQQPLSLNLYYLLSSFVTGNDADAYITEQRMMSVGLKSLYDHPIVRLPAGGGEFTVTTETESVDEQSRLWQGVTRPLRASAVYKVSVVFITPEAATPLPEPVREIRLDTFPTREAGGPFLAGFARLDAARDVPEPGYLSGFGAVAEGETFVLHGLNLDPTADLILRDAAGTETTVSWTPTAQVQPPGLRLTVSAGVAPGFYQVFTRQGGVESNAVPLAIAPQIERPVGPPPADVLITPIAGAYTVTGSGFVAGQTEVFLGSRALNPAPSATLNPGQFRRVSAMQLRFMPPADLAPSVTGTYRYAVRVRVNGVEAPPILFMEVVVP